MAGFRMGGKPKAKKGLEKNFAQITAPIGGMIKDLKDYEKAQQGNEAELEVEKKTIELKIETSQTEQRMSSAMGEKLEALTDPNKKLLFADVEPAPEAEEAPIDLTDQVEKEDE